MLFADDRYAPNSRALAVRPSGTVDQAAGVGAGVATIAVIGGLLMWVILIGGAYLIVRAVAK